MYFKQRKSRRSVTPISDETIGRLAKVRLFDSSELNNKLYWLHKELLRYSKYKNNNQEVGILWDIRTDVYVVIRGTDVGINVHNNKKANELLHGRFANSLVFIHNHPRNSNFSYQDLDSFCDERCIVAMTAVCNDGRIHAMKKNCLFNPDVLKEVYNEAVVKGVKGLNEVIRNASKLGLMYRCSVPRRR